jgi:hypothetical protein
LKERITMSIPAKNAGDFIRDLHTNAALLTEVQTAAAAIVTVARNNGYTVNTLQEISDALKAHWRDNLNPTDPTGPTAPPAPDCRVVFSEAPGF